MVNVGGLSQKKSDQKSKVEDGRRSLTEPIAHLMVRQAWFAGNR